MSDLTIAAIAGLSAFALALLSKPSEKDRLERERLERTKRRLDMNFDFPEQKLVDADAAAYEGRK